MYAYTSPYRFINLWTSISNVSYTSPDQSICFSSFLHEGFRPPMDVVVVLDLTLYIDPVSHLGRVTYVTKKKNYGRIPKGCMVVHERTLNVSHNEVTAAKCEPSVLHHTHVKCAIKMVSYFETVCVCHISIDSFHPRLLQSPMRAMGSSCHREIRFQTSS